MFSNRTPFKRLLASIDLKNRLDRGSHIKSAYPEYGPQNSLSLLSGTDSPGARGVRPPPNAFVFFGKLLILGKWHFLLSVVAN